MSQYVELQTELQQKTKHNVVQLGREHEEDFAYILLHVVYLAMKLRSIRV